METMSPLADKKARIRFNKALREKGVDAKACGKCFAVKALAQYNAARREVDGRQSACKACKTATSAQWYAANRERASDSSRQWYSTHREQADEYRREWESVNRESRAEGHRRWYAANRERAADRSRSWRLRHPERYLTAARHYAANRRARIAAATIIPFTVDEMLAHWADLDLYGCAFCGGPYEDIEHLVPLSRGGEHSLANIVPSCIECNRGVGGKHARDPWEWLAERFPALAPVLLPDVDDEPAK